MGERCKSSARDAGRSAPLETSARGRAIKAILTAILALGLLVCCSAAAAQDDSLIAGGLAPYGSFHGGDLDSVNLYNGNVVLHAPLISFPQRGGDLRLSFILNWNRGAYISRTCVPPHNTCITIWAWGSNGVGPVDDQTVTVGASQNVPIVNQQGKYYKIFSLQTPDGSNHVMGLANVGADTGFYSQDGTGLFSGGSSYVEPIPCSFHCGGYIDRHGIWYAPNATTAREDSNGNKITYTDGTNTAYVDTMGRTVPLPPAPSTTTSFSGCTGPLPTYSAALWNLPAEGGGTATYKLCFAQVTFKTPTTLTCANTSQPTFQPVRLQSVLLPNSTSWVFEYNDPDASDPSSNYGSLTKITFPTGGSISYTYETVGCNSQYGARYVATRTVDALDGPNFSSNPHTWIYTWGGGFPYSSPNTVTDPYGNYAVHTFGTGATTGYETEVQYYNSSSALQKTVETSYQNVGNVASGYMGPSNGWSLPTSIITISAHPREADQDNQGLRFAPVVRPDHSGPCFVHFARNLRRGEKGCKNVSADGGRFVFCEFPGQGTGALLREGRADGAAPNLYFCGSWTTA